MKELKALWKVLLASAVLVQVLKKYNAPVVKAKVKFGETNKNNNANRRAKWDITWQIKNEEKTVFINWNPLLLGNGVCGK